MAALIRKLRWLPSDLQSDFQQQDAAAVAAAQPDTAIAVAQAAARKSIGGIPGLTITSFHLQQLQASKQAGWVWVDVVEVRLLVAVYTTFIRCDTCARRHFETCPLFI